MLNLVLLDKTDITVKTPVGSVTLAIAKRDKGHACGLWAGDTLLASSMIPTGAGGLIQAGVIGPLLLRAKDHLAATVTRYPDGLEIHIRVEHQGRVYEVPGRIPLDADQLAQFMSLVNMVRKANDNVSSR